MDGYTFAIIAILILAIQGLGLHSIFTLYSNEGKLRQTLVNQGRELIRLRNEVNAFAMRQSVNPAELETLQQDRPLDNKDALMARLDTGETLDELIARYELDEAEAWYLLQQEGDEQNPTALN